jgi:hypothetical protein
MAGVGNLEQNYTMPTGKTDRRLPFASSPALCPTKGPLPGDAMEVGACGIFKVGADRSFNLTWQGFTLLVMGWTGERARCYALAVEAASRQNTPADIFPKNFPANPRRFRAAGCVGWTSNTIEAHFLGPRALVRERRAIDPTPPPNPCGVGGG